MQIFFKKYMGRWQTGISQEMVRDFFSHYHGSSDYFLRFCSCRFQAYSDTGAV